MVKTANTLLKVQERKAGEVFANCFTKWVSGIEKNEQAAKNIYMAAYVVTIRLSCKRSTGTFAGQTPIATYRDRRQRGYRLISGYKDTSPAHRSIPGARFFAHGNIFHSNSCSPIIYSDGAGYSSNAAQSGNNRHGFVLDILCYGPYMVSGELQCH